jgi:hypothetical protein
MIGFGGCDTTVTGMTRKGVLRYLSQVWETSATGVNVNDDAIIEFVARNLCFDVAMARCATESAKPNKARWKLRSRGLFS